MKWKVSTKKEFIIKTENRPGTLHIIASLIGSKGINIESISAYTPDGKIAIFRLVTADPVSTEKVLRNATIPLEFLENEIVTVELENKPGELAKLTEFIYKKGIDLNAVYIIRSDNTTEVAINSENNEKLKNILLGS